MASINPLRYRGYYYDSETGLYYLLNRYYDPVICRFINADDTEYIGISGSFASFNLFAYCDNNPVVRVDVSGHFSWKDVFNVAAVVSIVALGVAIVIASGGAAAPPLIAAMSTLAGTAISTAFATTAALGVSAIGITTMGIAVAASNTGSHWSNNASSKQSDKYEGRSTFSKNGERIDYEYYGNGNGNVHYDGTKGKEIIWRLKDGIETMYELSKTVSKITRAPQIQKAIYKAIDAVLTLAGLK